MIVLGYKELHRQLACARRKIEGLRDRGIERQRDRKIEGKKDRGIERLKEKEVEGLKNWDVEVAVR